MSTPETHDNSKPPLADATGYAFFVVRDLTKSMPAQAFNTRGEAERWVAYLWEWQPNSRPVIVQETQPCSWETVSPPSTCGKPAEYESTNNGKLLCCHHGEHMARKFPALVVRLHNTKLSGGERATDQRS